jgi:hypothetical protein
MAQIRDAAFGYSEYWRKNKSAVESQELARVLFALRKVGRHITTNLKPIEWAAGIADGTGKIGIDIGLAKGKYPLPPCKMDLLVGITAREALHCYILSDVIWLKIRKKIGAMPPDEEYLFALLIGIGEDIFARYIAKDTIWKHYLPFCWPYVRQPFKGDVTKPPKVHTLLYIFANYVFLDRLSVNMHPGYHDLFQRLLDARDAIIASADETSKSARCNLRTDIYLNLWHDILLQAKDWLPADSIEDLGLLQGEGPPDEDNDFLPNDDDDSESIDERQREAKESDLKLLKNVNEVIEQYSDKSFNEHLEEISEEEQWKIIDTTFGKASLPCRMKLDPVLVARLRRIFKLQKSHRSRRYHYNRGLLRGKIDGRRLYRLSMNGRLFRLKEHFYYDNTRNIVILVDGSASMTGGLPAGGKQWSQAERIFVSLFEAVKGTGNRLDVYSYFERAGICEINLLAYNKKIYTVRPSGRTPTGQAIIAAAVKMPRDKKRLIVHLTDGEPNCGVSVQKGLEFCDSQGIEIVTIGTYYDEHTKELLEQQYHDRAILVDSLDLLPLRLEEVLRASLLK